jgi:hypothetical protein
MTWIRNVWQRFRYVIGDGPKGPLLIRYRLISSPWFGVYLHHLMRSDADRHLHDHPWAFWSLILWRGYCELEPLAGQGSAPMFVGTGERQRINRRPPLWLVRHLATDRHALELDRPAWSLIWVGRRVREWGFHTEDGWVPWQEYVG